MLRRDEQINGAEQTHASKVDVEPAVFLPTERDELVLHVLFGGFEVARWTGVIREIFDERRGVAPDFAVREHEADRNNSQLERAWRA